MDRGESCSRSHVRCHLRASLRGHRSAAPKLHASREVGARATRSDARAPNHSRCAVTKCSGHSTREVRTELKPVPLHVIVVAPLSSWRRSNTRSASAPRRRPSPPSDVGWDGSAAGVARPRSRVDGRGGRRRESTGPRGLSPRRPALALEYLRQVSRGPRGSRSSGPGCRSWLRVSEPWPNHLRWTAPSKPAAAGTTSEASVNLVDSKRIGARSILLKGYQRQHSILDRDGTIAAESARDRQLGLDAFLVL